MDAVRWSAYGAFGLAGLAFALFVFDGLFPPLLGIAVSLALSGVLLLALDKGLRLLVDIRDAVRGESTSTGVSSDAEEQDTTAIRSTRTVAELRGDLDRAAARLR